VIGKAVLTVIADNKSKMCGQANPPLTASYSGFVNGESATMLTSQAVLATPASGNCDPGTYPINVNGAAAANYTINYVDGQLNVASVPQVSASRLDVPTGPQFVASWPTVANHTYQLEYKDDLSSTDWTPVGMPQPGTGGIMTVTNFVGNVTHRFFRLGVQ
jgi:hypothetical protein